MDYKKEIIQLHRIYQDIKEKNINLNLKINNINNQLEKLEIEKLDSEEFCNSINKQFTIFQNKIIFLNNVIKNQNILIEELKNNFIKDKKINIRNIDTKTKYYIFERDNYTCQMCGAKGERIGGNAILHIDHIIPINVGGSNQISNLQVLCNRCNYKKGGSTNE